MNLSKVTGVRGEILFVRSGIAAKLSDNTVGYRYAAGCEDLSSEVILDETFIRYQWAYQWPTKVRPGKSGLAAYFTYGTQRQEHTGSLAEFSIEWEQTNP